MHVEWCIEGGGKDADRGLHSFALLIGEGIVAGHTVGVLALCFLADIGVLAGVDAAGYELAVKIDVVAAV
ncbi:MAG: hypothetical protein PUE35_03445 [Bacteroidales bacterium]|nr:hypothetical protein [Bacteroidales bacterium]